MTNCKILDTRNELMYFVPPVAPMSKRLAGHRRRISASELTAGVSLALFPIIET